MDGNLSLCGCFRGHGTDVLSTSSWKELIDRTLVRHLNPFHSMTFFSSSYPSCLCLSPLRHHEFRGGRRHVLTPSASNPASQPPSKQFGQRAIARAMALSCCSSFATAMAMTSALNFSSRVSTGVVDSSNVVCSIGTRNVGFGLEFVSLATNSARQSRTNLRAGRGRYAAGSVVVRAEGESVLRGSENQSVERNQQLAYEGPGRGGQWLSSTTRHVRIYVGVADPVTKGLDQSQLDKLTLMLDPDNEFVWPEDKVQKVYAYFTELVDIYAGADCTEYTLRLIGSDIEHFIRKMLLNNEIKYNLECGVLNFSMGQPRYDLEELEEEAE